MQQGGCGTCAGIEKSAFHPLEVPQLIEECFDQILATVNIYAQAT
jgi:hypothetical protein